MNWDMLSGLIRHILTFAGGFIVARGWLDEATLNAVIGALITLGGALWSIFAKRAV